METEDGSSTVQELERKVARAEQVKEIINRIHSAKDLDHIVVDLRDEILQVLDAELLTLYVVDAERREIYSKFLDINKIREIRVPISEQSIAGFVAKFRRPVNIADAYSRAELRAISPALTFDSSWDRKSGSRTKQILTFPIVADGKYLMGVIQLVNKKSGGRFTQKDEDAVAELAKTLGIAFFNRLKVSRRIPTKFDYLVAHNRITQADLEQAIREAQQGQLDVETVLLEQYQVPRADIGKSLSQFYRCPFLEYDGRTSLDPELLGSLNPETLRSNAWIPLKCDKDGVHILSDDPNNLNRIQEIKRTFPGRPIRFAVGLRADILQFLDAVTGPAGHTPGEASVADAPSRSADAEAPVSVVTAPPSANRPPGTPRRSETVHEQESGNADGADRTGPGGVASRTRARQASPGSPIGSYARPAASGRRTCTSSRRAASGRASSVSGWTVCASSTRPCQPQTGCPWRLNARPPPDSISPSGTLRRKVGGYTSSTIRRLPCGSPRSRRPGRARMWWCASCRRWRPWRWTNSVSPSGTCTPSGRSRPNPPACSSAEARRAPAPPPRSARFSARSMWPSARSGASKTRSRRHPPVRARSRSKPHVV